MVRGWFGVGSGSGRKGGVALSLCVKYQFVRPFVPRNTGIPLYFSKCKVSPSPIRCKMALGFRPWFGVGSGLVRGWFGVWTDPLKSPYH